MSHDLRTIAALVVVFELGAFTVTKNADAIDCRTAKTQREINDCTASELREAGGQLDRSYEKYLKALAGDDRDRLAQAQRAWEQYRDLDCNAAEGTYGAGTMASAESSACKSRLTRQRVEELDRIYGEPPRPSGSESKP